MPEVPPLGDTPMARFIRAYTPPGMVANKTFQAEYDQAKRAELLMFCEWLEKDEFGEGHEEEITDKYLAAEVSDVPQGSPVLRTDLDYLHARLDALQQETAYALAEIKLNALPPHPGVALDSERWFNEYLATFKESDRQAKIRVHLTEVSRETKVTSNG